MRTLPITGLSNLLVTPPVSSGTDREFNPPTVSIPKLKHDFVRIGVPVSSTTPVTSATPVAKPEITTTKRPWYREYSCSLDEDDSDEFITDYDNKEVEWEVQLLTVD
ncbi:hypothetical protein TNCV_1606221 [Trichonephila clavipes]|nr:hypothetical protein TNCV_1606221 [Trichonephila clavipes]